MEIDLKVKGGFRAASEVRRSLAALSAHVSSGVFENIVLMVNELVTNAVRHGMAGVSHDIDVTVRVNGGTVHVDVLDPGLGSLVRAREPSLDEGSGWGLNIVDRLADRWGHEQNGSTRVWFEIDL